MKTTKAQREYSGKIIDPIKKREYLGKIVINNGIIENIQEISEPTDCIIMPGFIDSHIHIESSMLTPINFSKGAVRHGTIAVVADPHEIANTGGIEAIEFFIENAKTSLLKIYIGAPSCVPASPIDDCFQPLGVTEIESLMKRDDILFLSEMMNFPGVINNDKEVLSKIKIAHNYNKPIDGHAPGLSKDDLQKYVKKGISTDHESFSLQEAREKIELGMNILIREGSAAKNFTALHPLISENPSKCMFCTDDCHPDDLIKYHINRSVKRSIELGYNIFDILQCASVNPVKHYNLNVGLLQVGDPADFIVVNNLVDLKIISTVIDGVDVLQNVNSFTENAVSNPNYVFPNSFDKLQLKVQKEGNSINIIEIVPNELVTKKYIYNVNRNGNIFEGNLKEDIIKLVVVNRYNSNQVFTGFIKGFGLNNGAFAASIAHDSHHIIATGCDDESIDQSISFIISNRGGIVYCSKNRIEGMALPVYGIISNDEIDVVANNYKRIVESVKQNGVILDSPFMTLSFMALTVIPLLKISPKGLFDVGLFKHISLFNNEEA